MRNRGFTIVEILIVVFVMGVLLTLGVSNLRSSQISARDSERKTDVESIAINLENFYRSGSDYSNTTTNRYPSIATTTTVAPTLSTGLVSYWKLDDTSGSTATDSSGSNNGQVKINANLYYPFDSGANDASTSNNNGTVYGATLSNDRFNNTNSAYSFNGSNNYISTPALTFGTKKRFYSAWIKINSPGANTIIDGAIQFKVTSTNKLRVQWSDSTWHVVDSTTSISTGVWTHVVLVYDGSVAKFYINGAIDATTASFSNYGGHNPSNITIGRDGSGGLEAYNGSIDEVLIGSTTGNTPHAQDIAKLYSLTSSHDMNKPYVSGKINSSFDLWGYSSHANDSVCSYIDMGTGFNNSISGVGAPFTISFWINKRSGVGSASNKQIGWYGGNYKGSYIGIDDDGFIWSTIGQGITTGSWSNYDLTPGPANPEQWNHIVLTYDGSVVSTYLNGNSIFTHTIGSYVDNGSSQSLIVNRNPWDYYTSSQGRYDEIGVWSRSINSSEVSTLYSSGNGLQYPFVGESLTLESIRQTLRDIDSKSLLAPGMSDVAQTFTMATNNNQTTAGVLPQPTINQYIYQPIQSNGSLCTLESQECRKFNLYYRLESDNSIRMITSRNQ
jgi:prepilin-type N-terminal cleavage/methylation domain-containing protein